VPPPIRIQGQYLCGMSKKVLAFDPAALELRDEPENRQFVARVGDLRARVEYERNGDRIFLTLLDIPKALEPLAITDALLEKVLTHIEEKRWKLIPTHPVIKAYMRAHPAWQRLLLKGVQLR